jgi:hypothetical protein
MLINRDTTQWDANLLTRDAEIIQTIPISGRQPRDLLIWAGLKEACSVFTVKSAYHMLLANQFQGQASSSSIMGTKKRFWNSIWSAFVPSKVRVFVWNAFKDI